MKKLFGILDKTEENEMVEVTEEIEVTEEAKNSEETEETEVIEEVKEVKKTKKASKKRKKKLTKEDILKIPISELPGFEKGSRLDPKDPVSVNAARKKLLDNQ